MGISSRVSTQTSVQRAKMCACCSRRAVSAQILMELTRAPVPMVTLATVTALSDTLLPMPQKVLLPPAASIQPLTLVAPMLTSAHFTLTFVVPTPNVPTPSVVIPVVTSRTQPKVLPSNHPPTHPSQPTTAPDWVPSVTTLPVTTKWSLPVVVPLAPCPAPPAKQSTLARSHVLTLVN